MLPTYLEVVLAVGGRLVLGVRVGHGARRELVGEHPHRVPVAGEAVRLPPLLGPAHLVRVRVRVRVWVRVRVRVRVKVRVRVRNLVLVLIRVRVRLWPPLRSARVRKGKAAWHRPGEGYD